MFIVQNISRDRIPYVSGMIRSRRNISKIDPLSKILKAGDLPATAGEALRESVSKNYQQTVSEHAPRRKIVFAHELMTSHLQTINPDMLLSAAWKLIAEKRFRHLPVVDENGLIGLISDRDILREYSSKGNDRAETQPVSQIMHTDLLTATPDTEIREIARVLIEERIGCMLIVNSDSALEGIITRSDILRALIRNAPLDLWT